MVTPKARAKHEPFVQQTGLWSQPLDESGKTCKGQTIIAHFKYSSITDVQSFIILGPAPHQRFEIPLDSILLVGHSLLVAMVRQIDNILDWLQGHISPLLL